MNKIILDQWHRKSQFLFYRNFDYPKFSLTVDLDVTKFYEVIKREKLSFYFSMMYLVMKELNDIENFRYRIVDGEPYLVDISHPSFTDSIKNTDQFKIVNVNLKDDLKTFISDAKKKSIEQGSTFIVLEDEIRQDLVYISTFPWAKFTQVSHAYHQANTDAIPRIVWGKFEKENELLKMPFSIEVHHGFVDGLHVGLLINKIQDSLNNFDSFI